MRERLGVLPVVDDRLQQVRVAPRRHGVEEAAADDLEALGDRRFEVGSHALDDVRLVEQDAAQVRVRLEQPGEERARPTADVDDLREAAEVVGVEQRPVDAAGDIGHRAIEHLSLLRVVRARLPDVDAVNVTERVLARAHAVQQVTPRLPDRRASDECSPAVQCVRGALLQQLGERRRGEASAVFLAEDPDARKRPQQPVQGSFVRSRRRGEVIDRSRPVRHEVGDTEGHGDVDRLGDLVAVDQPSQLIQFPFLDLHSSSRSTKTSISPPHGRPTAQASSSAIP